MKLSDLQAFVDIVDAGGLTAAAAKRGVTQPALSRLLRDLETRMKAQLLHRTGRGIELTPAGTELLEFAIETLARFDQTRHRIAAQSATLPAELHLSVPLRLGRLLVPGLYRVLGSEWPQTTVHIVEEPTERALEMISVGALDAALTYRSSTNSDRNFVPIFGEALHAVGAANDLGHQDDPIAMRDLCSLPLLLPNKGKYRELIHSAFTAAGLGIAVARSLETAEVLLAFACEGEGVAILPMSNIYQEVARGEVVARPIVDAEITRTIGVELSPGMTKHTARHLLKIVRQALQVQASAARWRSLKSTERTKGKA